MGQQVLKGPVAWRGLLATHDWQVQSIGRSDADVFRLVASDGPSLFVKSEIIAPFAELAHEIAALRWLEQMDLPAPRVVDAREENGRAWLLMSALEGTDMASTHALPPEEIVRECARALRRLHAVDPAICPFDRRLETSLALAERRMNGGVVDETDFDGDLLGMTARDLFAVLCTEVPAETDLVVCHGDASMPNFMLAEGGFSGYLDCARLGIADRHQDLAIATRSIAYNFGEPLVEVFVDAYGTTPNTDKIAFYRTLDEFF